MKLARRVPRKGAQKLPRLVVVWAAASVWADGDDPRDPVARHQRDQQRSARTFHELPKGGPVPERLDFLEREGGRYALQRLHHARDFLVEPVCDRPRGGQQLQPVRVPAPHPDAYVDRPQRPVHDVGQGRRRLGRGVDRTHPLGGLEPEVAVVVAAREYVAPDPGAGPVPKPGPQDQGGQDDGGQEEDQRLEREPHLPPAAGPAGDQGRGDEVGADGQEGDGTVDGAVGYADARPARPPPPGDQDQRAGDQEHAVKEADRSLEKQPSRGGEEEGLRTHVDDGGVECSDPQEEELQLPPDGFAHPAQRLFEPGKHDDRNDQEKEGGRIPDKPEREIPLRRLEPQGVWGFDRVEEHHQPSRHSQGEGAVEPPCPLTEGLHGQEPPHGRQEDEGEGQSDPVGGVQSRHPFPEGGQSGRSACRQEHEQQQPRPRAEAGNNNQEPGQDQAENQSEGFNPLDHVNSSMRQSLTSTGKGSSILC